MTDKSRLLPFVAALAIILLGAIAYLPSLGGGFILDDELITLTKKNNIDPRTFYDPGKIFSGNLDALGIGAAQRYFVYRPLHLISYLVDHAVWEWNPFGYHLTNVILHILVSLLVLWMLNIVTGDALLASLAATLFAVHPVHTETASYIAGRGDAIAAVFMLFAFILYLRSLRSRNPLILSAMACSYALALFGKEVSLILPVAAVFYHVAFGVRIRRASLFILIAVAAGFLALRAGVLSSTLPHLISQGSLTQRLPGFFIALISYLKILFWPAGLHMEYGNFLFPWNDPRVVAGAAVLGLLIWAFMWCRRRGLATAAFGIGWFAILLLPQSNLYPVGAFMAEHWLYLPSIGFFVIVALLLKQLIENDRLRNIGVAIFLIVAGGYTALTMAQAAYWKDPVHFYERTLKYVKTSRFCNNLGRIYAQQGDHRRAVELYEDALASGNPTAEVYVNAGVSYGALGMNSRAEEMFVRALALNPRSAEAFRSAGDLYTKMGRLAEALEVYRKSLAIKSDPGTLNNMAEAYRLLGHTGQAADLYKETIAKDEQNAESYNNLGALALQGARIDEAIELLQKAISFKNDYTDAMNNLGTAYSMKKEYDKAIELFRKCIALRPGFASAHNNLAVAYYSQGKMDDARAAERRAIELGFTANPRFLALLGLTADELSTP